MRISSLPTVSAPTDPPRPTHSEGAGDRFDFSPLSRIGPPGARVTEPVKAELPISIEPAQEAEQQRSLASKVALSLAFGTMAVGGMLTQAVPALAATVNDNSPVQASSVADVVRQFRADKQLYVVGHPAMNGASLSSSEMGRMQAVLAEHPHAFIVLVDKTVDLKGDDLTLSRGIGNSEAFRSLTNPALGEKDAVVVMMYFNVNGDASARKIFMRTEALPDRLGVGEQNFADPNTGAPRELLQQFINEYKATGSPARGLGAVFTRVDRAIAAEATNVVTSTQTSLANARQGLQNFQEQLGRFQQAHGPDGELATPPVDSWARQLDQAQQAMERKDFSSARALANQVQLFTGTASKSLTNYEAAGPQAETARADLARAAQALPGLDANEHTTAARDAIRQGEARLQAFEQAYRAKDPSYGEKLGQVQQSSATASREVEASRDASRREALIRNGLLAAGALLVVATGVVANMRAREKKREAQEKLDSVTGRLQEKSKELLELLNTADFHKVEKAPGVDELVQDLTDALTLVGGAEKFVAEARGLVEDGGLVGAFTTGRYREASEILSSDRKLRFTPTDAAYGTLQKGSRAETWREQILARGNSQAFEESLEGVLGLIEARQTEAKDLLVFVQDPPGEAGKAFAGAHTATVDARTDVHEAGRVRSRAGQSYKTPSFALNTVNLALEKVEADLHEAELALKKGDFQQAFKAGRRASAGAGEVRSQAAALSADAERKLDKLVEEARRAEQERLRREEYDRQQRAREAQEAARRQYEIDHPPVYTPPAREDYGYSTPSREPDPAPVEQPSSSWWSTPAREPDPAPSWGGGGSSSPDPDPPSSGGGFWGGDSGGSGSTGGSDSGSGGSGSTGGSW